MALHGPIGVFGKIPSQGDFLHIHANGETVQSFAEFLEEASDSIHPTGCKLPAAPVSFLYRAPGIPTALVGVFAPSTDRLGRVFPLSVFVPFDARELGPRFPAVPAAFGPFLSGASSLIGESASLDKKAIAERLAGLSVPNVSALYQEEGRLEQGLASESAAPWQRQMIGDRQGEAPQHGAFDFFSAACRQVQDREPDTSGVTLDCPFSTEIERYAWLDLARRLLRWKQPPSFFWRETPRTCLLISLGPASTALFGYLAEPQRTHPKIWSLAIDRAAELPRSSEVEPVSDGPDEAPGAPSLDSPRPMEIASPRSPSPCHAPRAPTVSSRREAVNLRAPSERPGPARRRLRGIPRTLPIALLIGTGVIVAFGAVVVSLAGGLAQRSLPAAAPPGPKDTGAGAILAAEPDIQVEPAGAIFLDPRIYEDPSDRHGSTKATDANAPRKSKRPCRPGEPKDSRVCDHSGKKK